MIDEHHALRCRIREARRLRDAALVGLVRSLWRRASAVARGFATLPELPKGRPAIHS